MDFKNVIIMSDLDGTLLDDKKEISPKDMESINEFCDKGGMFTIATGRGYSMARPVAQKLKLRIPAVIFNGSAVYRRIDLESWTSMGDLWLHCVLPGNS